MKTITIAYNLQNNVNLWTALIRENKEISETYTSETLKTLLQILTQNKVLNSTNC